MLRNLFLLICLIGVGVRGFSQEKKAPNNHAPLALCDNSITGCNLFNQLATSQLVCSTTSITYPGPVGNSCVDGVSGTKWNCISGRNNQTWFYVKALTTGTLRFKFTNSANVDVDGIIWGPLPNNDFSQACNLTTQTPLACDYDRAANVELPCLNNSSCGGTASSAGIPVQAGQIFIMCILNYSDDNTNITISQPTGGSVQYCMAPPVTQNCAFADCNSSTNCGNSPAQTFTAVNYLCQQQIIKGYTPQNVSANRILSPSTGASANIARVDLAKITTLSLLDLNQRVAFANNPTGSTFNAEKFDVPFVDLQTATFNSDSLRYPKILSYLQYQDGRSPFDRNRTYFEPLSYINRGAVLKVLLEAWNIDENTGTGTLPFSDVPTTHGYYKYIQKAYNLGIVTGAGGSFFPDANCTREDAFLMLYRIMTSASITKPTLAQINAGFFIPNTFRPDNLGVGIGNDRGNFNHYTKTSFAIDGTVPLVFAHSYNSYSTELPDSLFNNPLGRGWTHSFNCYVLAYGDNADPNRRRIVHYPDGTLHYYKENSSGTWVPESIGVFDTMVQGSGFIEITTPSKVVYRFETQVGKAGKYMLIKSIKDRNNNTLTFTNELGDGMYPRLKSVADPAGRTLNFLYRVNSNCISEVNLSGVGVFNGRKITFDYNIPPIDFSPYYLSLKSYTEPDLNNGIKTTQYGYFPYTDSTAYLLKTVTLPKGNVIDNTYQQRKLTSSRTMNGASVVQKMDVNLTPNYTGTVSSSSSVVKTTDENGLQKTTNYQHNTNGLPTQVTTTGAQPLDLGMTYGTANDPTAVTRLTQNGTGVRIQYYTTPPYNVQFIRTAKALGDSITQSFTYNSFNDVLTSTNGRGFTTTFEYNATGNLTKITDPLGKNTLISRRTDGLVNTVTTPTGIQTTFGYNTYGNLTSTSVANGANPAIATSAIYDALSRLTTTTDPRAKQTTYEYYANDLLKKTTAPMSVATNYNYDANDNLTTITNAKGFATTMSYNTQTDQLISRSFGGKTESFTYYDDGSLKTYTNKRGNVFTFTYDASGRVKSDSYATYDYNSDGTLNTITNTSNGRNYVLDYDYDLLKRISKTTLDSRAVQYAYDNNNNLTTLTYPDGKTVTYSYDNNDRLSTVTDWANRTTTYSYDDDGKLLNYTLPNGMKCIYTYDAAGRMTGMRNEKTGAVVLNSYTYVLDAAGNHLEENIVEPYSAAVSLTAGTTTYTTDNANLQTQASSTAGGNTYGFDNNGAINNQAGQTLTYDTRDNLLTGYGNSYYYDGNETRRAKTGKRYIINELTNSVIAETDDAGNYQYYYVYGPTGLLYRQSAGGTTEFYHYDFRGSTIATTNASQTVVRQYQYDAFGKILQQTPTTEDNPFRYVGQHGVQYENANLYFMRARYYDPNTGRFVSEDPIWATNLYPYADNNPVMMVDANGKSATTPTSKKTVEETKKMICINTNSIGENASIEGHAWISVIGENVEKQVSEIETFGTFGNQGNANLVFIKWPLNAPKGLYKNLELSNSISVSRCLPLTKSQEKNLHELMSNNKNTNWTAYKNCAAFASFMWNEITGEKISPGNYLPNPSQLGNNLNKKNNEACKNCNRSW